MALASRDRALVTAASDLIRARFVPEWHHLAAALRTRDGQVFRAINVDAYVGCCSTCAEAVAVGMALSDGKRDLDTIVTVRWVGRGEPQIVSPCGICRENLVDFGNPWVIHPSGGRITKKRASALLPDRYGRPEDPRRPRVGSDGGRRRRRRA